MSVQELIRGRLVHTDLTSRDKHDAILELVDFMIREGALPAEARDHAVQAAFVRESCRPTGTEFGIALPHGITDAVTEEIAAIGIARHGVPFDGLDGKPARIIILVLTPPVRALERVHTLRKIACLVRSPSLRKRLVAAESREAALELLRGR